MASTSICGAHLLEALLVADAEALLLVDDEQAEVLELEVFATECAWVPMRMSTLPVGSAFENFLLLLGGAEARDHLDVDGKFGEAALEAFEVLEAEHGGGREHGDLLAILHGLEGGAHGDLGLAVADVAAEQAVHGLRGFHVGLDVGDGGELVVGLVEVEGVLELALHVVVRREGGADRGLALRVELEQLFGHVLHGLLDARLGLRPGGRAERLSCGAGPVRWCGTSG